MLNSKGENRNTAKRRENVIIDIITFIVTALILIILGIRPGYAQKLPYSTDRNTSSVISVSGIILTPLTISATGKSNNPVEFADVHKTAMTYKSKAFISSFKLKNLQSTASEIQKDKSPTFNIGKYNIDNTFRSGYNNFKLTNSKFLTIPLVKITISLDFIK